MQEFPFPGAFVFSRFAALDGCRACKAGFIVRVVEHGLDFFLLGAEVFLALPIAEIAGGVACRGQQVFKGDSEKNGFFVVIGDQFGIFGDAFPSVAECHAEGRVDFDGTVPVCQGTDEVSHEGELVAKAGQYFAAQELVQKRKGRVIHGFLQVENRLFDFRLFPVGGLTAGGCFFLVMAADPCICRVVVEQAALYAIEFFSFGNGTPLQCLFSRFRVFLPSGQFDQNAYFVKQKGRIASGDAFDECIQFHVFCPGGCDGYFFACHARYIL